VSFTVTMQGGDGTVALTYVITCNICGAGLGAFADPTQSHGIFLKHALEQRHDLPPVLLEPQDPGA
jgi:hypothetical protein